MEEYSKINYNHIISRWWNDAVSVLTGLRVWLYGIRIPVEKRDFLNLQNVHTVSEDQPASSSEGALVPSLGVK